MGHSAERDVLTEADESALFEALVRHAALIERGDPAAMVEAHNRSHVYVAVEQIVREHVRAAYTEAVQAFRNLHPMHGNTAGCYGGIGGAAITSECAIDCPNPKHDRAQHDWRNVERKAYGVPTQPYITPPAELGADRGSES